MNTIVYDSDLIISDESLLSCLCIFYDKIILPYLHPFQKRNSLYFAVDRDESGDKIQVAVSPNESCSIWENKNRILFDEGVIGRLSQPKHDFSDGMGLSIDNTLEEIANRYGRAYNDLEDAQITELLEGNTSVAIPWVNGSLYSHFRRTDISFPRLLDLVSNIPTVEQLKTLQVRCLFRYFLPKTAQLEPEAILQVREKVKDTREGFSLHLQKLSGDLKRRLLSETNLDEVESYANDLVVTQIIPDYREFCRQLSAERSGFWANVLDKTGKIIAIEAPIWTAKFYSELLKAFGFLALMTMEEKKERLSNKSQTFQFLRSVEQQFARIAKLNMN